MEDFKVALKEIKAGKLFPVYVCLAQNRFFLEKFLSSLKDKVFEGGLRDFNYEVLDGSAKKVSEILDSANQLPAFAKTRLIIVENFKVNKGGDENAILDYMANPSGTSILVVMVKDQKSLKPFDKLKGKRVRILDFKDPYEKQLPYWIKEIASGYGKQIDQDVSEYFINLVGNDLERIDSEISKLISYVGDKRKISVGDLEEMVCDSKVETIFEFIDSLSAKNLNLGLRMLEKMLKAGEVPLRIISMLSRHYRILWKVKKGIVANLRGKELASACGVNPFFVGKYADYSKTFSFASLARSIGLIAKADVEIKSLPISKELILEKLCLDLTCQ